MPALQLNTNTTTSKPESPPLSPNLLQLPPLTHKSADISIALNIPKMKKEIKQSAFKPFRSNIDCISLSLSHMKGSISYFSHLDILPNPSYSPPKLQNPYQIAHAKPSSQSQKVLNYNGGEIALNNLQLSHKFVLAHSLSLRKSSLSLNPYNPTTGSKPELLASLNSWNPTQLPSTLITKPQFPKSPLYVSSKELVKPQTILSSNLPILAIQITKPAAEHTFIVTNSSPTLCLVTTLPAIGKSFIPYNLNNTTLDTLVTLYLKEIPPSSKTFFAYHQAIVSSFQENNSANRNISFS